MLNVQPSPLHILQRDLQKMPRPLPLLLTEEQTRALARSRCAFCQTDPPLHFGRKNVALHRGAKVLHARTTLPSCAGCWAVRYGATPQQLRAHARTVHRFMMDTALRVQSFEEALALQPQHNCAQALRKVRKREKDMCDGEDTVADDIKMFEGLPCYYCGQARGCGLDRVDSYTCPGYSLSNVVPACQPCNKMKHVLPAEVFLRHMARLATAETGAPTARKTKKKKKKETHKDSKKESKGPPRAAHVKTSISLNALQRDGDLLPGLLSATFGYDGTVTATQLTRVLRNTSSRCFGKTDTVRGILGHGISALVLACKDTHGKWFALKLMRPGADLENMAGIVQTHNAAAQVKLTRAVTCFDEDEGLQRMPLMLLTLEHD